MVELVLIYQSEVVRERYHALDHAMARVRGDRRLKAYRCIQVYSFRRRER